MAAVQVLTGCNLRWWSFSSAIEHIYFLAHVVVRMVRVLARGHCNLHWWSFSMTNWRRYSTGTCGGGHCNLHWWSFSMTNWRRYSTGTCGCGHCNLHWWSFSMTNWRRYSTGTCGCGYCDLHWWWTFLWPTSADTLLAQVVVAAIL